MDHKALVFREDGVDSRRCDYLIHPANRTSMTLIHAVTFFLLDAHKYDV